MRILVLNQYFHPDQSATSQLLTELCEDLARYHEVCVVTGRPSYDPTEKTNSHGLVSRERHGDVQVHRVWSTSFHRSSMTGRLTNYGTYLASSIIGTLMTARPDVVVAFTDPPPIGTIGMWTASFRRVPFVLVTKDVFPDVAVRLGKLTNPAVIGFLRGMSRSLFRHATKVVSIGRDMNHRLMDLGVPEHKITTIHDWSDGRLVRPLEGPSQLRKAEHWEGRFVVMHSGNVGFSQSLESLIDAAELLRSESDILLAIVGEGSSKQGLQRDVARRGIGNVAFIPYQPKVDLADSLGAADVHVVGLRRGLAGYIVPSKVYGIMAAGKPFVAAVEKGSEPALIVEETGCGIRVEPDDPQALAEGIHKIKNGPIEEMGRRGRRAFEQRFDRGVASQAYLQLLEQVGASGSVSRSR